MAEALLNMEIGRFGSKYVDSLEHKEGNFERF